MSRNIVSSHQQERKNMEKKTFANKDMVGTPRGYVKKSDMERVDREMTPILEGATTVLSLTPLGRALKFGRKGQKLIGKNSQKLLSGPAKAKDIPKKSFEEAITVPRQGRALERMYRAEKATAAAKKAKEGRAGSFSVKGAEKRTVVAAAPKKAAPKKSGPNKKRPGKSESGTLTSRSRIDDIKKSRGPFGTLAKRANNLPKAAEGGSKSVRRFGDYDAKLDAGRSRIVGLSPLGKAAVIGAGGAGLGAAAYMTPANKSTASERKGGGPERRQGSSAPSVARKSEPMSNADVQKAYQSINTGDQTDRPVTEVRRRIATPKTRPADHNTSAKTKKKVENRKVEKKVERKKPAAERSKFKANWKNAAPTAMQKRAGVRPAMKKSPRDK
jgi:hypothetical protein